MDTAVDPAEVAKYRDMMRNGRSLPSMAIVAPPAMPQHKPRKKTSQTTERFKTLNEFVDYSARLVDTTAQAVWMVLFRETKPNGLASVSQGQIAERVGLSRRSAIRAVQTLENAKLITVVKRGKKNGGPSFYRVHALPRGCDMGVTGRCDMHVTGGVTKRVKT